MREERDRQDTQEKEKMTHMETLHTLGEGGQKAVPTSREVEAWRRQPTCISGSTEPLTIYKSITVLCKWIGT